MAWRRGLCSRASGQPAADFSRPSQAQAPFRVLTFSPWFRLPGVFRSDLDQIKFVSSIRAINDGNVSDDGCTNQGPPSRDSPGLWGGRLRGGKRGRTC